MRMEVLSLKANKNLQQELPLRGYLLAALTAIELLMSFSFLGYFHVEPISITIAFIPVLLAGCLIGPGASSLVGLVFGTASMWKASAPYVTAADRVFSPFLSSRPVASLLLNLGSRVLFGLITGLLFYLAKNPGVTAVCGFLSSPSSEGRFILRWYTPLWVCCFRK